MFHHCKFAPQIDEGDPYLVHAEVTGQGPIQGLRHGHAFVLVMPEGVEPTEENIMYRGHVIDRSNMRNIKMPAALYFAIGRIFENDNFYLYDCDRALSRMAKTHHFGPWDLVTSSGL